MCTILVLNRVSELAPVIIAANRDEFYARATRPPEPLPGTRAIAGIDEVGGGSWLGVTATGFFVGLTNQRQGRRDGKPRRSRGEVVTAALARADTAEVERELRAADPATYNPFNLLFGTSDELRCAYVRDEGTEVATVPEGISVLPNDVLGSPEFPKAERARAHAAEAIGRTELTLPSLADALVPVLATHDHAPESAFSSAPDHAFPAALRAALDAMCIHTPAYGTRSFSIVALAPGAVTAYLHGDGPPCQTVPRDLTAKAISL